MPNHQPRTTAASRHDAVLATPSELRDRIRQLGPSTRPPDDPRVLRVRAIVDDLGRQDGPLLPVLHAVQDALGCIPPEVVGTIADGLNLSRAEVHGVVTYYHHFRSAPAGRHVVALCRAEACQAMGGDDLWRDACGALGLPAAGGTSAGGAVTLDAVYCLGLCAQSPAMVLDGRLHARLTAPRLLALLAPVQEAA